MGQQTWRYLSFTRSHQYGDLFIIIEQYNIVEGVSADAKVERIVSEEELDQWFAGVEVLGALAQLESPLAMG